MKDDGIVGLEDDDLRSHHTSITSYFGNYATDKAFLRVGNMGTSLESCIHPSLLTIWERYISGDTRCCGIRVDARIDVMGVVCE